MADSNSKKVRLIEYELAQILTKLHLAIQVLAGVKGGTSGDVLAAIEQVIQDQDASVADLSKRSNMLSSSETFAAVSEIAEKFALDSADAMSMISEVSDAYDEMKRMSIMLLRANEDEAVATARIEAEMSILSATAARIGEELKFIEDERERLVFKAASEECQCPLPEVLDAGAGLYNPTWLKLYNRGTLESTYN